MFLSGVMLVAVLSIALPISVNARPNRGYFRDLLLIVDSSSSMGSATAFATFKEQLAEFIGMFCPYPDPFTKGYHRLALIQYSSHAVDVFDFDDKSNTSEIQDAILGMPFYNNMTCTAEAFQRAIQMFSTTRGMRTAPNIKHEVLLITGGQSNCAGNSVLAAQELQNKAEVFALTVGTPSPNQEILQYVSASVDTHLFAISGYQNIGMLVNVVKNDGQFICAPFDV